MAIEVNDRITLDDDEIVERFVRSPGPGGQNVNKVATAVLLRFDVRHSPSLPDDVRERLIRLAGSRMTTRGELLIDAHRFRTLERNRRDAIERLVALIDRATAAPKPRKATRPTRGSVVRRLDSKRRRANAKQRRRAPRPDHE